MDDSTARTDVSPVLTDMPRYEGSATTTPSHTPARQQFKLPKVNVALFLLTLLTTTMAGAYMAGADVSLSDPHSFAHLAPGLSFSIPLMLILGSHEMGHYIFSRRYGVNATLPYFIPLPLLPFPPFPGTGTLGAFILMRSPARTRRAMFDIGAAGPWAGMAIALPAVIIGLKLSQVTPLDNSQGGLQLGNSLLFWGISRVMLGVDPNSVNVNLHPIAFAGWLGLFVTTLNLLPVGQLDGGHVIYALFGGRRHRVISRLALLACLLMVVIPYVFRTDFWGGWLFWFVLLLFLGLGHPSTVDAETPLTGTRRWAAWATIVLFLVTFSQVPFSFEPPSQRPKGQIYNAILHRPAVERGVAHRLVFGG
jgi:membrane-associated protease RseP (regulator of RpoE activity)